MLLDNFTGPAHAVQRSPAHQRQQSSSAKQVPGKRLLRLSLLLRSNWQALSCLRSPRPGALSQTRRHRLHQSSLRSLPRKSKDTQRESRPRSSNLRSTSQDLVHRLRPIGPTILTTKTSSHDRNGALELYLHCSCAFSKLVQTK